ncbi:MAG TPA: hypothetical protein VF380_01365 [Solirubrobacteraceae bacterium]
MATVIADPPPATAGEAQSAAGPEGSPPEQAPTPPAAPAGATCAKCGSPMAPGQDWCLQCGAGAPDSLGTPGWRSAAMILGAVAVLVLGAAAAAFAALGKSPHKAAVVTATIAQAPTPTPPVSTPTPIPTTPTKALVPPITVKPPKIPLTPTTPKPAVTTPATTTPATTTPTGGEGSGGEEGKPTAILLDTNAASTYNPYNYAATNFGDPSLAIDGEASTGWTAQVEPSTAPRMAEGLLINLKTPQKVSALQLVTTTPGMTVQVYGAHGSKVPTSITDPAWIHLTPSMVVKKRHVHITLKEAKHAFTLLTLWISKAPASAIGTPQAPGHISVNELELFPG